MEIKHKIYDSRIDSLNLLLEVSIEDYYNLSKEILDSNEYQRRRVKSSASVYNLLKTDLKAGCVIPPIVLAVAIDAKHKKEEDNITLLNTIIENKQKLIILDGLQRTYTIRDMVKELLEMDDPEKNRILKQTLRVEIYLGINKIGILYRMLTLNTGQTPMSSRHQIEIIYSDYITTGLDDIKLIKEVDDETPSNPGEYKFKDIIDGFTSYLERDYLTIERTDILDNIRSLEKLATANKESDLFVIFTKTYDHFVKKIVELGVTWNYQEENFSPKLTGYPFARTTIKIFNKSQTMTGFGSAIGKLLDFKAIKNIEELDQMIDNIKTSDIDKDLNQIIIKLDNIRNIAKKIGNDQRMLFHFFFRELFDSKSDGYLNIAGSIGEAYKQYERKTQ